jgi:hypothetical protein
MNTETENTETAMPNGSTSAVEYLDKKGIARRLGISVRKVDYLRSKKVLPCYVVPTRCIRFNIRECDEAMKKFRQGHKEVN